MRRLILVLTVACACGQNPPVPAGRADEARETQTRAPSAAGWMATADGMPLFLRSKFEPADGTVHVPPVPPDLPEEAVLFGNELGPDDEPFLDAEIVTMMGYAPVYACIELPAGLFVLRTPSSQPGSTDLVLAAWNRGRNRLVWIADLAWSSCADDGCTRQEAWLSDTTDDSIPELMTRAVWTEADSDMEEVTWTGYAVQQSLVLASFPVDPSLRRRLAPAVPEQ